MKIFGYTITYLLSKVIKKLRFPSVIDSEIHKSAKVEAGTNFVSSRMGRYSFCGYDCDISHCDIGAFTSIASGVVIGGARHPMEWVSMSPVFYRGRDSVTKKFAEHTLQIASKIYIGSDVWIGRSAIILPGVCIGNGAVVGAGAVVTKDVPSYAIAVGNPAKIIRYRFSPAVINQLEEIKWWEFSDAKLANLGGKFNDLDAFLHELKSVEKGVL
ncbi:transferase hexapeptide (six repeat-containing protein) [Stutzerimonas kunmingensis]|uniref:CatB-related O-acetyltransferase n=1 Tax=Stutzerimonas kunmingensis TaxID=1211807 RepID=UPI0008EFB8FE|nr:CatB-related O-acetyltransferase [Stutzerimonas kunmingensis]MCQ2044488.1 CatB-related O-acetyltransferase [Stutzerimonas kunmingensis]SFJ99484.1 transferase hexapeptide (six repeat-containing protein) [Stutzerimonas kunmingensis]